MSRFYTTTIFLVLIGLGVGLGLEGAMRWLALGLLLSAYIVILVLGVSILRLNFFVKATCRGEATTRRVALTFDDGPDPVTTPKVLKVLNRHGIKAAFFPIGTKVKDHPEIIKQIDQQGHILGNHTFRHAWWTNFMMGGALEREIGRAQGAIEAAIGKLPAYFRPPMGLSNPHLKRGLRKHGLSVIGWDVRAYDTGASKGKAIKRVLKKIRNGSIILLHDAGKEPTHFVTQVDNLVTEIKVRKYTFSGLEDITGIGSYHTRGRAPTPQSRIITRAWHESGAGGRRGRLRRFFAQVLASSAYVKGAIQERANLDAFKTRPSRRFLIGVGLVLFSYVLGWPMVGLFSVLAAYCKAPALLMVGPAFYGFSHLIWVFGIYLAGRDSIKYAHMVLRWSLRKVVERNLYQGLEGPREDRPA
jgi:peptidoglycan/xylan/chitin deacetylase (PgdA/CDA1 family)